MVQRTIQQKKEAMKEVLEETLKESAMEEDIEDPDGEGLNRYYSRACYSCGENGHLSQQCTNESHEYLLDFPTEEVEFDPQKIE